MVMYCWISSILADLVTEQPFSWPSMVFCWMAVNTSLQLMAVGLAPRALNTPIYTAEPGTRIFRSFRSSGLVTGCLLLVSWRKPLWKEPR